MELWVRSQDRMVLTKIYDIRIDVHNFDEWRIQANLDNNEDYYLIGIYKTKERALEVLDEIQRLVTDLQYLSYGLENDKFCSYRPNVYEMPKE